ncbi:MAG: hypothetical protein AAGB51_02295 [Planctomycetota bacterium]
MGTSRNRLFVIDPVLVAIENVADVLNIPQEANILWSQITPEIAAYIGANVEKSFYKDGDAAGINPDPRIRKMVDLRHKRPTIRNTVTYYFVWGFPKELIKLYGGIRLSRDYDDETLAVWILAATWATPKDVKQQIARHDPRGRAS